MKTTTTLLVACLISASFSSLSFAQNSRTEMLRKEEIRKAETKKINDRKSSQVSTARIQIERNKIQIERNRNQIERNRNRILTDIRIDSRSNKPTFREYKKMCIHCSGKGFSMHFDGLHRLTCSVCNGLGHLLLKELYIGAMVQSGRYELEEIAEYETDRLDLMLDLSRNQWNRIYRINYKYLIKDLNDKHYSVAKKERDIRNVLNSRQKLEYAYYLDDLRRDRFAIEWRF